MAIIVIDTEFSADFHSSSTSQTLRLKLWVGDKLDFMTFIKLVLMVLIACSRNLNSNIYLN